MNFNEFDSGSIFLILFILVSFFGFADGAVSAVESIKKQVSDSSLISEKDVSKGNAYYFFFIFHTRSESDMLERYGFDDFYELKEYFESQILENYTDTIWYDSDFLCIVFDTKSREFASFLATSLTLEEKFNENFEGFRRFFNEL